MLIGDSGLVHLVSVPAYPQKPRLSHSFDLKHSANLRRGPGRIKTLAWSGDGYCLAVGYEAAWAAWSMGGRLGGWGTKVDEGDTHEDQEAFMAGVSEMVSSTFRSSAGRNLIRVVLGTWQHGAVCPFCSAT